MGKRVLFIITGLLLAVLFLSTVGGFYTGNVLRKIQHTTLKDYPYPFIKNSVPNNLYIVIPKNPDIIEYDAAIKISQSLKGSNPLPPKIVTKDKLPIGNHNLILIGNSCSNDLIREALKVNKCNMNLKKGEGLIKLVDLDKTMSLIVSGYSKEEIKKSAHVLANFNFYPMIRREVKVTGEMNSLVLNYN